MAKAASKKTPTPDIEVLPVENPEQQQVITLAQQLGSFLGSLVPFFRTATELEHKAKAQLEHAQRLTTPTTAEEDSVVQVAIRQAKVTRKAIDEHWKVTAAIHGLHRRLTAGREAGGQLADQAADVAQRLHNSYVNEENRKARAETDRLRREAEAQEQREREEEQARLEALAQAAEEASPTLSTREQLFVDAFVLDGPTKGNVQESARKAGYVNTLAAAARLSTNAKVKAAIASLEQAELVRRQARSLRDRPSTVSVEPVKPQIIRAAGSFDRSTLSAEVHDPALFLAAVLDPASRLALGIPADTVTFVQTRLNELARSLGPQINKWPGVRLKTTTTTV
jgi:hypothetical protein